MAWHDEHQCDEYPTERKAMSSSDTPAMMSHTSGLLLADGEAASTAARGDKKGAPFVRVEPARAPDGF
jgi:hypothetical protein